MPDKAPLTEDDWTSDWPKAMAWDLWAKNPRPPPLYKVLDTRAELLGYLERMDMTLPAFLRLPAARPMPAKLRKELEAAGDMPPARLS